MELTVGRPIDLRIAARRAGAATLPVDALGERSCHQGDHAALLLDPGGNNVEAVRHASAPVAAITPGGPA
jgi:hypothetical protein